MDLFSVVTAKFIRCEPIFVNKGVLNAVRAHSVFQSNGLRKKLAKNVP